MKVGTIWRTRDWIMRQGGSPPEPALLESEPSRRITVMRLGTGTPEQPANISVTRRRSARPYPLPRAEDTKQSKWPPALRADGHPEKRTTI